MGFNLLCYQKRDIILEVEKKDIPNSAHKITDKGEPPRKKNQATRKAMDKGMNASKIKETWAHQGYFTIRKNNCYNFYSVGS